MSRSKLAVFLAFAAAVAWPLPLPSLSDAAAPRHPAPAIRCPQAAYVAGWYAGMAQALPIPQKPPYEHGARAWKRLAVRLCHGGI